MKRADTDLRWADLVQLRARYRRSVHLERDLADAGWLNGYIVTPLARSVLSRLTGGLQSGGLARAWSLTGPYGSGKSAFALFLTQLLEPGSASSVKRARELLRKADTGLSKTLFGRPGIFSAEEGLLPVRVTADRAPLDGILLSALLRTLEGHWSSGRKPALVAKVESAVRKVERGKAVSARDVVGLFETAAQTVASSARPGNGLLVVLDEAGKAFEYAAMSPSHGDVFLLQELAEAACRSGDTPLVFVTLLHQAFEHYAGQLSASQQNEWAKVQGRFEDVIFQESADQMLRLIMAAMESKGLPNDVSRALEPLAKRAVGLARLPAAADIDEVEAHVRGVVPLHPITAMSLPPLFRSHFSQNERSLFAFLGSAEPHGFQEFLREAGPANGKTELYTLDRLYDYIRHSVGSSLYGQKARRWAQIDEALRRLPEESDELDVRLIKAIGLLGVLGESAGLGASQDVLALALTEGSDVSTKCVKQALTRLRNASILVYRKYRDAYQLWEGSDLDVDGLVQTASKGVDPSRVVVDRLRRLAQLRPLVARRHLLETGTFRHFAVQFADETVLDAEVPDLKEPADGVIWIVIPSGEADVKSIKGRLVGHSTALERERSTIPTIIGVPSNVSALCSVASELAALESVLTNTPELHDDPIARRELETRLSDTERQLRLAVSRILGNEAACEWFYDGETYRFGGFRELTSFVSSVCDAVYDKAPVIRNELLNRRQLSSSAAAARRSLVQAMVERGAEDHLGFEGTPPEVSMYRSLLEVHQLHRARKGVWRFTAPKNASSPGSLRPAYDVLTKSLRQFEGKRKPLTDYYELLKRPPFGLKDGVIPVFVLTVLLELESELALYEDGKFIPRVGSATVERLLRVPWNFEVQFIKITTSRSHLLGRMRDLFGEDANRESAAVLPVVRDLLRCVRGLPDFTSNTRSLSKEAQAVREVLLRAEEPGPLLFVHLPKACGLEVFPAERVASRDRIEEFARQLKQALHELGSAYTSLLGEIRAALINEFELPQDQEEARHELAVRARRLGVAKFDIELAGFITQAADETNEEEQWLIGIGTQLAGKPPERWHDQDVDAMRANLVGIRDRFTSTELLMPTADRGEYEDGVSLLRIAVAEPGSRQRDSVVSLRDSEHESLTRYRERLRTMIEDMSTALSRDALIAGLALEASALLPNSDDEAKQSVEGH